MPTLRRRLLGIGSGSGSGSGGGGGGGGGGGSGGERCVAVEIFEVAVAKDDDVGGAVAGAVKSHEAAILSEAATFDMGHDTGAFSLSGLYSSIYNGALYQHTTSGDEKALAKETLHDLLCRHRGLRRVYAPIFAMLAAAGEGRSYAPDERTVGPQSPQPRRRRLKASGWGGGSDDEVMADRGESGRARAGKRETQLPIARAKYAPMLLPRRNGASR